MPKAAPPHLVARALLLAALLALALPLSARELVAVRLIAFNDLHGHLEPGANSIAVPDPRDASKRVDLRTGGLAFLAGAVRQLREEQPDHSQETYVIDWDFTGQSFESFVLKTESRYPVKFFYEDEWVRELILGNYGTKRMLNEILDTLFAGKSIYYYGIYRGNIILTKKYGIKNAGRPSATDMSFIPGADYPDESAPRITAGNLVVEIGNPADRMKSGVVTLSGYITNQETKEPVAGVTVYIPKLSAGTISNAYGFYKIGVPRGSYSARFTFIGMKEKNDGRPLTVERFRRVLGEELEALRSALGPRYAQGRFAEARALFDAMSTSAEFQEFLTLPAYDELLRLGSLKAAATQDSRSDPRG